MSRSQPPPSVGDVLVVTRLTTTARYRIVSDVGEGTIPVEVISAPGLTPGTRLRLMRDHVASMSRESESDQASNARTVTARVSSPRFGLSAPRA